MKDWKAIFRRLLFLPLWMIILLVVASGAALVSVFAKGWENYSVAYVVYIVSFYSLMVVCISCWKTFPRYYKNAKGKVYKNKYACRYLTDAAYKIHVSLYLSLGINLLYIATNAVSAFVYNTVWFGLFAVYYAVMAIMRFLLVIYVKRVGIGNDLIGELKHSRLCAYILMVVNLVLSGAVLMMVYNDRGFEYHGILIYVMAMYAFWVTTTAIIDLFRYGKYNSPIMFTSKAIKLAAAMVSMLSLETAMFSQFGQDESTEMQQIMIMATGGGIAVIVTVMSAYIIIHNTKGIRKLKNNNL